VFLRLSKGDWEFPAGAEEIDLLLFVMNEDGAQKLLRRTVVFGVDASIAEGQVAEEAAPSPTTTPSEVLGYSRADGSVRGINLSGAAVSPDADANRNVYGPGGTPGIILASRSLSAPTEATPFFQALGSVGSSSAAARLAAETPSPVQAARPTGPDLRTQLMSIEQAIGRLLADPKASPVGTGGRVEGGQEVCVSREQLQQLRSQIEVAIAVLEAR
jgi:hypothetical protein